MSKLTWANVNDSGSVDALNSYLRSNQNFQNNLTSLGSAATGFIDGIQARKKAAIAEEKQANTDYVLNQMANASSPDELARLQQAGISNADFLNKYMGGHVDLGQINERKRVWAKNVQDRALARDNLKDFTDNATSARSQIEGLLASGNVNGAASLLQRSSQLFSQGTAADLSKSILQAQRQDRDYNLQAARFNYTKEKDKRAMFGEVAEIRAAYQNNLEKSQSSFAVAGKTLDQLIEFSINDPQSQEVYASIKAAVQSRDINKANTLINKYGLGNREFAQAILAGQQAQVDANAAQLQMEALSSYLGGSANLDSTSRNPLEASLPEPTPSTSDTGVEKDAKSLGAVVEDKENLNNQSQATKAVKKDVESVTPISNQAPGAGSPEKLSLAAIQAKAEEADKKLKEAISSGASNQKTIADAYSTYVVTRYVQEKVEEAEQKNEDITPEQLAEWKKEGEQVGKNKAQSLTSDLGGSITVDEYGNRRITYGKEAEQQRQEILSQIDSLENRKRTAGLTPYEEKRLEALKEKSDALEQYIVDTKVKGNGFTEVDAALNTAALSSKQHAKKVAEMSTNGLSPEEKTAALNIQTSIQNDALTKIKLGEPVKVGDIAIPKITYDNAIEVQNTINQALMDNSIKKSLSDVEVAQLERVSTLLSTMGDASSTNYKLRDQTKKAQQEIANIPAIVARNVEKKIFNSLSSEAQKALKDGSSTSSLDLRNFGNSPAKISADNQNVTLNFNNATVSIPHGEITGSKVISAIANMSDQEADDGNTWKRWRDEVSDGTVDALNTVTGTQRFLKSTPKQKAKIMSFLLAPLVDQDGNMNFQSLNENPDKLSRINSGIRTFAGVLADKNGIGDEVYNSLMNMDKTVENLTDVYNSRVAQKVYNFNKTGDLPEISSAESMFGLTNPQLLDSDPRAVAQLNRVYSNTHAPTIKKTMDLLTGGAQYEVDRETLGSYKKLNRYLDSRESVSKNHKGSLNTRRLDGVFDKVAKDIKTRKSSVRLQDVHDTYYFLRDLDESLASSNPSITSSDLPNGLTPKTVKLNLKIYKRLLRLLEE